MSKHTPGPWRAITGGVECDDGHLCTMEEYGEAQADARLIAAAPEMYEALKRALMALEECGFQKHSGEMGCIRAALAKAEGRS